MWVDTLDRGDAHEFADWVTDLIIHTLRQQPRMPRLSYDGWTLLLADLRQEVEAELVELIDGKADLDEVARAVADELAENAA
jgi:hypothetical protein